MTDPAQSASYVDTYTPPALANDPVPVSDSPMMAQSAAPAVPAAAVAESNGVPSAGVPSNEGASEDLEFQNIFDLLGIIDGTEAEREAFLDELQQVIWEDLLANDVPNLITTEEQKQLDELTAKTYASEAEKQEAVIVFLEKIIPDLEEIMLEKALELKEDMMQERLASLKEFFVNRPDAMATVTEAEGLIARDKWRSAYQLLNKIQ